MAKSDEILQVLEKMGDNKGNYLNLIPVWNKLHDAHKAAQVTLSQMSDLSASPLKEDLDWLKEVDETLTRLIKTMNQ
jgi:hypothetical protein